VNAIRLLPVVLSCLVLGAHFLRAGFPPLVVLSAVAPFLLLARRPWAARTVQVVLILGGLEWVRTVVGLAQVRYAAGEPWMRMAIILTVVALFTMASALVFRSKSLRERYHLTRNS